LIDHINAIVYPEGALPFGSHGTATLFLDDVRISTNVRLFGADGAQGSQRAVPRALGTRVSMAVREAVLGRGSTWLDRAFVVSDWYVSAYAPLADGDGRRVGMLYVGYLERPFTWLKYGVLAGIGGVFFAVMVAAALWSARRARQIFRPLEQMAQTMADVEAGRLAARVGPVASGDEIGALAGHLDHLLDAIAEQTAALQRWNAELDTKVAQRTAALAQRTHELQAAQNQLLRAEKMAAVGQLTASIAHEVNNPIAVIQGNLDLVRELLGEGARPVADELKLVDAQIERMRLIVTQLLQFARPNEYAGYVEAVDAQRTLEDCLVLTNHLLARGGITVQRRYAATRPAGINRQELQQVLVNLIVNALQAMPDGGVLTLTTADWTDGHGRPGVAIGVADTGPGLADELLAELFQPFVTRKKDGTGLGLWISRSLVERYGGDIVAANRPAGEGGGAELRVLLLSDPEAAAAPTDVVAAPDKPGPASAA
jgi:C4-dicarboxylate-specific signal transduction histidine kinase